VNCVPDRCLAVNTPATLRQLTRPQPSTPKIPGMARRSLRKIDPALDLSSHLKTFEELPRPWDAVALFGRVAPLEVEVGSGKGLFLRSAAQVRPEANFLGIEVAQKYAQFSAAALAKRGLDNAVMAMADAVRIFAELLPDGVLAAVHIYFPDPWWKKRHKKRRVMRASLLRDVERTLQPGGTLHFWTDVDEYFQTSLELLAAHTHLIGPLEVPESPAEHDMAYRTHFERRMRLNNEPVYRSEFRKASRAADVV
jgi:tRNA (guanine-N7-)-methyltransferase